MWLEKKSPRSNVLSGMAARSALEPLRLDSSTQNTQVDEQGTKASYQHVCIHTLKKIKVEIVCLYSERANKCERSGHNPAFVLIGSCYISTVFSSLRICD